MEQLIIAVIILGVLTLLAIGILIFIVVKNSTRNVSVKVDESESIARISALKENINALQERVSSEIKLVLEQNNTKNIEKDNVKANQLKEEIQSKLTELNRQVQNVLKESSETNKLTFSNLGETLTKLTNANNEVLKVGDTVKELNRTITGDNQKRGRFGEFLLESILESVYGDTTKGLYERQYSLGPNLTPDAVVFLPKEQNNIIAIDSKFPYSNYYKMFEQETGVEDKTLKTNFQNDVMTRIKEIAEKYIIPKLTADYALCFIPSDEVYNYINVNFEKAVTFAKNKRVIIVSPATLQPVLYTLKSLSIEYKRSQMLLEINNRIIDLAGEFSRLTERWNDHSKQLNTLNKSANELTITINKLDKRFTKIKDATSEDKEE